MAAIVVQAFSIQLTLPDLMLVRHEEQTSERRGCAAIVHDRSAASFDNPDHVAVVIHNYRWRLGQAEGEARYDDIEKRLAASPNISVPTITMEGDANGAPHPPPTAYRAKFTGRYEHRGLTDGIGHNLPQEAPAEFARALLDLA